MINIFVLVTILGHLPVILSAKSKGSENMEQILIVEDDSFLNKMLAYNLTADGYGVTSALNARTAAEAIRQREFDLVLLDINLPDGNGFELCKLIKPQHPDTIVIFLTANDQESDQIRGYEVGAVDYITKPFVIGALQRKIKAMFAMLEHHKPAKDIYDDGRLFLDFSEQTASLNGKPLTLSPMEYKMLNLFRKNPRQVLTRGQLLEKLWDIDERFVDEHTLTTSISRIRSKIESDGGAPYIKTVYVVMVSLTLISSWIMVSISIRKPVKIAAGISPIEAVRFTPVQKDIRSRKKNIKLNPVSMGIANFKRDRKKTISIIASLSLGGIILLVVSSIVLLRSPEALARQIYPYGDYKIYLHSELAVEEAMAAGNPLNEKLKQEILAIDGVTDVITKRQSLHINYRANGIDEAGWCDILTEQNYSAVEAVLIEGTMPADAHSIIIDSHTSNRDNIRVGETVEVTSGKSTIPVTISGVFDNDAIPTDGHGTVPVDSPLEFAPEALFHELHPEIASFDYSWNIVSDPKKADNVESELKNIVATHTDIALENIDTIIEYEKNINSFVFGSMEVLSWLVFLFGVINLINTTLSNQMSRKQENSVLRSIGLTQKQLCKMNICEGLCYAFFATLATLIVGLPASIFACRKMSIAIFAGKVVPYKFPVLEMGLFILVLFGMELILSVWTVRRQKKQSLIEQMRTME